MYRVLIADDERLIREGLRALIDWESRGFSIACVARDAFEALAFHRTKGSDLIIADIRMPGMDGLDLLKTIREKDERVRCLILSGFADFEYAKRAMKYRADGYLLKPVDEAELTEQLGKIKAALDAEAARGKAVREDTAKRREAFIREILAEGGRPPDEGAAAELGLIWNSYRVLLVLLEPGDEGMPEAAAEARASLRGEFEGKDSGVVFTDSPYLGVLLRRSYGKDGGTDRLGASIRAAAERCGAAWTASIGQETHSLSSLRGSYETAVSLMKRRFLAGENRVISAIDQPREAGLPGRFDVRTCALKAFYLTAVGDRDRLAEALRKTGEDMAADGMTESCIKTAYASLLSIVLERLRVSRPGAGTAIGEATAGILEIRGERTLEAVRRHMLLLLVSVMGEARSANPDTIVTGITEVIEQAYDENVKLESIAGFLGYNSAYIGKLFKAKTGEYFNTYLDKVRIRKAKELLLSGMKVYEVSKAVGYAYVDYFHAKFRKYEGVPPTAFRALRNDV